MPTNAYEALKHILAIPSAKIKTVIDVSILPYTARFIADPFIAFSGRKYHILCEIFVCDDDKRISHLTSTDAISWVWVADVIKDEAISFPAFYPLGEDVIIIPQLGGKSKLALKAYRYNFNTYLPASIVWTKELPIRMSDRLVVANEQGELFIAFGENSSRSSLAVSRLDTGKDLAHATPHISAPVIVRRRTFFDILKNKLLKLPKPTHRPAGNVLANNNLSFTIPIQATISGKYGECLALLTISWNDFKILKEEYIYPSHFSTSYRNCHHLSWSWSDDGIFVFCGDMIDSSDMNWKIFIFEVKENT